MSGPRPWMGEPEAPTTLTQARPRIDRGQVPFSICTCWTASCGPAAGRASGSSVTASAAHEAFGCLFTMILVSPHAGVRRALGLVAFLAERAALELELDVSQLDDVVVDQVVLLRLLVIDEGAVRAVEIGDLELSAFVADGGVLARDLLVGEHHVAVRGGAEDVLSHPQAEVLALVLAVERHQPAADLALPRVLGPLAQVGEVDPRRALAGGRHRHGHSPAAAPLLHGHHLLHLEAVRAHVPARVHHVPVRAHLAFLLAALEEGQDAIDDL